MGPVAPGLGELIWGPALHILLFLQIWGRLWPCTLSSQDGPRTVTPFPFVQFFPALRTRKMTYFQVLIKN